MLTGGLVIAAFVLSGCAGTTSGTAVDDDPCADVLEDFDERTAKMEDLAREVVRLEKEGAPRGEEMEQGNRVAISVAFLVADNPSCFDPGLVADWKALIPTLEGRLRGN